MIFRIAVQSQKNIEIFLLLYSLYCVVVSLQGTSIKAHFLLCRCIKVPDMTIWLRTKRESNEAKKIYINKYKSIKCHKDREKHNVLIGRTIMTIFQCAFFACCPFSLLFFDISLCFPFSTSLSFFSLQLKKIQMVAGGWWLFNFMAHETTTKLNHVVEYDDPLYMCLCAHFLKFRQRQPLMLSLSKSSKKIVKITFVSCLFVMCVAAVVFTRMFKRNGFFRLFLVTPSLL